MLVIIKGFCGNCDSECRCADEFGYLMYCPKCRAMRWDVPFNATENQQEICHALVAEYESLGYHIS